MRTSRILWTALAALAPAQVWAQGQLTAMPGDVGYQLPLYGHMRWTSGLLVGCDYCESKTPVLWAATGAEKKESIAFSFPDADFITVRHVASGPDGSLAAVGLAVSGSSRMGTFITWIPLDRSKQTIMRVWPYAPNVVTVAPDGTIWTVGSVINGNYRGKQYNPSYAQHLTR